MKLNYLIPHLVPFNERTSHILCLYLNQKIIYELLFYSLPKVLKTPISSSKNLLFATLVNFLCLSLLVIKLLVSLENNRFSSFCKLFKQFTKLFVAFPIISSLLWGVKNVVKYWLDDHKWCITSDVFHTFTKIQTHSSGIHATVIDCSAPLVPRIPLFGNFGEKITFMGKFLFQFLEEPPYLSFRHDSAQETIIARTPPFLKGGVGVSQNWLKGGFRKFL